MMLSQCRQVNYKMRKKRDNKRENCVLAFLWGLVKTLKVSKRY